LGFGVGFLLDPVAVAGVSHTGGIELTLGH
jgi:hypothetical protein